MTRQFVQQILDRISTELPNIRFKGLYNLDFDKRDEGTKASFDFPAIFVSFPEEVEYINYGSGVQHTGEFIVRLYIAQKHMTEKSILDIYDLKQSVFNAFQSWQPVKASTFNRIAETTDESRTNYYVFIQDYTTKLVDDEKYILNDKTEFTISNLKLDPDLKIDPNTVNNIRTDKTE